MRTRVNRRLAGIIVLVSLGVSLLIYGCGLEGAEFGDAFSEEALDLVSILGPIESDFSTSDDTNIRASGQTGAATEERRAADAAIKEAQQQLEIDPESAESVEAALANNLVAVNRAIDLAPTNVQLRLEKAVVEVATNQSPATTKAQTIYVIGKFKPSDEIAEVRFLDAYIRQLGPNVTAFENALREDMSFRVRVELCAQYAIFERDYPDEFNVQRIKGDAAYRYSCASVPKAN